MKTIESKIAPNPKEAQIWVDLSADPSGSVRKTWNGKKWINKDESEQITEAEVVNFVKPYLNEIKDELKDIQSNIKFLNSYHDEYVLKLIKELANRISKLEKSIITE